jgi:hypothetical protein
MLCIEEKTYFSLFMSIASCLLFSACATIEYPNGTKVTVPAIASGPGPYVFPVAAAWPALRATPYGTGGVYGGGYYPVFGPGNYGWTPRVLCN